MGTLAIDEMPQGAVASNIAVSGVGVDDANNLGKSNPVSYTAPVESKNIMDRLASGFTRSIAETPQMLGQGMYYLGSNLNPEASLEEQKTGDTFGDRMARAGLVMTERNKQYIAEHYSEDPDIWERVGGAVPMVGALAIGALMGFPQAAAATAAVTGGVGATVSAFTTLRQQRGKSTEDADALASLVGAGAGSAMAFGIGNFLKATGGVIAHAAKGVINGFTGGVVQSAVTGSLELATGTQEYKDGEGLIKLMSEAVKTGVTFAILGGPLGVHMALVQHNAIKEGFKNLGLSEKQARDAAKVVMAKGIHEGLKHVEKEMKVSKAELSRIKVNPLFQQKPVDESGAPRPDSLDVPYEPPEPTKAEALTTELEQQKEKLKLLKKDIKDLEGVLAENKELQGLKGQPLKEYQELVKQVETEHKQKLKEIEDEAVAQINKIETAFSKQDEALKTKNLELNAKLTDVQRLNAKLEASINVSQNEAEIEKFYRDLKKSGTTEDQLLRQLDTLDNQRNELARQREHDLANVEKKMQSLKDVAELEQGDKIRAGIKDLPFLQDAAQHLADLQKEETQINDQIEGLKEKLKPRTNPIEELSVQISKIQQGFRHGKSIAKGEMEFVQKEFTKLINGSDLAPVDKAKFLQFMINIQTEADFFKALPEINHRINLLEQRAEQKEWVKDIKKVDLTKLPVEYQDVLKPLLDSFDFSRPTKDKIMERAKTLEFFMRKLGENNPDAVDDKGKAILSPGERQALDDASRLSVSEILTQPNGHERLRAIHDMIMSMAHEGKMKNKYLSNLKQRDHEKWVEGFLAGMKDPKNVKQMDNLEKALQQKNQSPWEWFWGKKDALQQEQMTPELVMDVLGLSDEHQILHEAYQQKLENQKQALKQLEEIHDKADVREALSKKQDVKVSDKTYKGITGNELLKVYAQSFDEGGSRHLKNTFGKEELKGLLEKTKKLYPEQTKSVQKQFEYFRTDGYVRLDKVVQEMQGHHMPKVNFYDPIGSSLEDRSGRDLQHEMQLGAKGMFGRAVPESGFTKARVKSKLAFDKFDYYGDLVRNAIDRENYIAMATALRDMNKKFYDPRVTTAISDRFGPNMTRIIQKWLKDVAFDGHQNDSASSKALALIRQTFIGAKIGFNPFSAGKVLSQLSPAADFVGSHWVLGGTRDYLLHPGQLDKFIDDKSLMMRNRYLRQERDYQDLIQSKGASALAGEKIRVQIIKLSMVMHQVTDKIVTRATWIGAYNKAIAQNFLGNDAVAQADSAVRYTHPMGGTLYLPDIFRGSEFQKAMTTFHGATNRNFNLLLKNNRDVKNTFGSYLNYAKTVLSVGVLPAIFLSALNLHRGPSKREVALEFLNQTTGSDIWLGVMTNALMSGHDAGATTPWTSPFTDTLTSIKAEKLSTKIRYGLAAFDDISGLSTANVFRMATGQMFQPRGHEGFLHQLDDENSEDGNPFRAGGI